MPKQVADIVYEKPVLSLPPIRRETKPIIKYQESTFQQNPKILVQPPIKYQIKDKVKIFYKRTGKIFTGEIRGLNISSLVYYVDIYDASFNGKPQWCSTKFGDDTYLFYIDSLA